mmetsp:Transcript_2826/g.7839  ORF Transcript_2826/g.7839 Transcript_2826/m.7839 type:complete len:201 (-) Transcript_2826:731-1333(-)
MHTAATYNNRKTRIEIQAKDVTEPRILLRITCSVGLRRRNFKILSTRTVRIISPTWAKLFRPGLLCMTRKITISMKTIAKITQSNMFHFHSFPMKNSFRSAATFETTSKRKIHVSVDWPHFRLQCTSADTVASYCTIRPRRMECTRIKKPQTYSKAGWRTMRWRQLIFFIRSRLFRRVGGWSPCPEVPHFGVSLCSDGEW